MSITENDEGKVPRMSGRLQEPPSDGQRSSTRTVLPNPDHYDRIERYAELILRAHGASDDRLAKLLAICLEGLVFPATVVLSPSTRLGADPADHVMRGWIAEEEARTGALANLGYQDRPAEEVL